MRQHFTLGGKPVPPEIFRDMGDGDMADSQSIRVSVDVKAAIGSNLYYDEVKPDGVGWLAQRPPGGRTPLGIEEYAYRYIGATANGLLVVITATSTGGSGDFFTLHILDLAAAKAFTSDGEVYDRINVTSLREVPLGDRWDGTARIDGNTIIVTTTRSGPADNSGTTREMKVEAKRP
jgi:predicted RNA-binding protein with TRAM domain